MDKPWVKKLILTRDTMHNLNCGFREAAETVKQILNIYNAEV